MRRCGENATTKIAQLHQKGADPEVRNAFFDGAVHLAGRFEIEVNKPRNDGRQRHRP